MLALDDGAAAFDLPANAMPEDVIEDEPFADAMTADDLTPVAQDEPDGTDLFGLSLEELLSQEVTSAAKKSRRIADSAAAITVITQDDIMRSAARTVPDLLRMVPGMEIAEVQSSATSVSSRGFTSRFAANLLVMVDGAAIYSTSISGMFWDQALIPLQDIERIEVIRGPGGTLWGSNSISGIVNIITKQSIDTQDIRLNASVGTFDIRGEVGIGRQFNDEVGARIYGSYRRTEGLDSRFGSVPDNNWEGGLAGVRVDYAPSRDDNIVVLFELSDGNFMERLVDVSFDPFTPVSSIVALDNVFSATHALARWNHSGGEDFDLTVQGYFNSLSRTEFEAGIDRDLYDLSIEGRWRTSDTHEFNFGVAGRISHDHIENAEALSLPSSTNNDRWLSGYLQDDITLLPDVLRLTIGSKFELNNFTGTEIQPSARIFYRFDPDHAVWASASRAVRTPLLLAREMVGQIDLVREIPGFPVPVPIRTTLNGNPDAEAEEVLSFEAGIRGSLGSGWSYDAAAFYSEYNKLATSTAIAQTPIIVPPIPVPVGIRIDNTITNLGAGTGYGMELLLSGPVARWWQLDLSYSYLDLDLETGPESYILFGGDTSPKHQFRLNSAIDIGDRLSVDAFVHYVSGASSGRRDAYTDLDIRATYRVSSQVEMSLVGSNLLDGRRLEFFQDTLPLENFYVPRSAYVEARLRF